MELLDSSKLMKKYIYAVITTCIGVILIGLNTKTHNPPIKETVPKTNVQAPQPTIVPKIDTEPQKPVEAIVEPIQAPAVPEQRPILDNDAKAFIYAHESGNCPTKWQGEHGACPAYHGVPENPNVGYGLCQSTPASKMAVMGPGWETSWDLQDQWCTQYANNRYGGWQNAYYTWISQRWW